MNIGIIGAGNGGISLHADLKLSGIPNKLYFAESNSRTINKSLEAGVINLYKANNFIGSIGLESVTTDLFQLICSSDVIYNTLPIFCHIDLIKQISEIVKTRNITKQIVLINLSGGFSPYFQHEILKENNVSNIVLASTSSFPYACRVSENNARIESTKTYIDIGFVPHKEFDSKKFLLGASFITSLELSHSVLEIGLKAGNFVFHPGVALFNLGLMERHVDFKFYSEGITPGVSKLLHNLDLERLAIAKHLGFTQILSDVEQDNIFYGTRYRNYYDFAQNSETHKEIVAPKGLNTRYLSEDIPYGLVPLSSLAKLHDIETPYMNSMITIYSGITGVDYHSCGYTFKRCMQW